jgi:hypothetical protein
VFGKNAEIREKVFNLVIKFFQDHSQYSGEGIMQQNDAQIDAPILLADLADKVFKFKLEWNSDDSD